MNTETAARRFADALRETWAARDVDRFTALYSDDAPFRGPFATPESAAEHMRRAFALGEGDPEVWVGDPVAAGAGTAWLRFDETGLVTEEHGYWHAAPG